MDMMKRIWTATKKALRAFDIQRGVVVAHDAITPRQEILGILIFSLLFFSWGLAYGLLDIMNYHIKVAMGITRREAAYLAMAYYTAYIPGALGIGGPLVKSVGYRFAAVVGLLLLASGDMVMSVGAAALNFSLMCGAHLVVGLGVSTLERAANAFAVENGPRKRAAFRILAAQSAAALGTVFAPLLANAIIFDPSSAGLMPERDPLDAAKCLMPPAPSKGEAGDLGTVVEFYRILGAAIFVFAGVLAVLFFRTRLVIEPVVPRSPRVDSPWWKLWAHPLVDKKFSRLWLGCAANFWNLGCQVTVAQFFMEHMRINACANESQAATYMMAAQILFVAGRLVAAGLISLPDVPFLSRFEGPHKVLKPRFILAFFVGCAAVFTGMGITLTGKAAVACICLVMFAEAPSFPMAFEAATADLGEWTPTAESLVIVSITGGGVLPLLNGMAADTLGVSKAWGLATGFFGLVFCYTALLNVVPSWKQAQDKAHGAAEKHGPLDVEVVSESVAPTSK